MNRKTILTVRLVIMLAVMTILCAAPLFAFAEENDHVEEQTSYSLIKNSDASEPKKTISWLLSGFGSPLAENAAM